MEIELRLDVRVQYKYKIYLRIHPYKIDAKMQ